MLPYPHDRHNGFAQVTDGNGHLFVPDFSRSYDRGSEAGNAMAYAGAFLVLAQRVNNQAKGGSE